VGFSLSPARCCWLASAAAHALIVAAGGHAALQSVGVASAAPERAVEVIAVEPLQEPAEAVRAAPVARVTGVVTPPTHTHPYPVPADHDAHPHDPSLVHVPSLPVSTPASAAIAPEVVAAPEAAPRFAMTLAASQSPAPASSESAKLGDGAGEPSLGSDGAPYAESGVTTPARLVGTMSPTYPPEARAEEIEADVALMIVVSASGSVIDARVAKPAGFGFDDTALAAVRAARFTPALREGRAVAVRMRWSVSFRLR